MPSALLEIVAVLVIEAFSYAGIGTSSFSGTVTLFNWF